MELAVAQKKQNIIRAVADYGRQLFGFIRGRVDSDDDAEDILQEVWYQLSIHNEVEAIESLSGWLHRVARNKITDKYRKKKSESLDDNFYEEDERWIVPEFLVSTDVDPETAQWQKLFKEALFDALQELPAEQRDVFIWNELGDRTLQEIADHEQENIKTIISRKRYAVLHLRKRLEFLYNEFLND